jgi:hypothetical protein
MAAAKRAASSDRGAEFVLYVKYGAPCITSI